MYFKNNEESSVVVLNKVNSGKPSIDISEVVSSYDLGEWLTERELV